jgi:glycosyltransferase involved in cell wall biosynthesis
MDGNFLTLPYSGIGTYVRELSAALRANQEALGIELVLIEPRPGRMFQPGTRAHRFGWDTVGIGAAVIGRKPRADVLHLPQMSAPIVTPAPCVVTIHDTIPLVMPDYRRTRAMQAYLALMARTARQARRIIVPSQSAAADVRRILGVDPALIDVIAEAASRDLMPDQTGTSHDRARQRFEIPGPYLFNIGGFDKRKNLPLLIDAFGSALRSLPDGATLVIAGAPHSSNPTVFPPLEPIIERLGLRGKVLLTGKVTDDDRRLLYQGAVACISPSMYEGFGLTPLEAMACGTPVIVANRTSLPEVVGDAGLIVEPEVDPLAEAIIRIMTDPALRRDLGRRSVERAASFSWDRVARQTANVYRTVVAEGHPKR